MGRLTTHILDTANGTPAAGVAVRLYAIDDERRLCATSVTNDDGRTDGPLLAGEALTTGSYDLEFDIGEYFRSKGIESQEPAFLDTVVIRVALRDDENYHVPLLVSPWSYSTYRGS
jgi:5-hydroxyisourate hydrolase